MYAWRARIGLIQPTHRGKGFGFWYDHRPEGVEIVPTYIGFRRSNHETFEAGIARAEELAVDLVDRGCTGIAISGTPPFLLKGPDFERQWGEELSSRLGVPVVTPMAPHVVALQAMGARSVAVASYYGPDLNNAIVDYLAAFDIRAHPLGGYDEVGEGDSLYTTSLAALDNVSFQQVYTYCKSRLGSIKTAVDALYINGAGWDAPPAIDYLERDLRINVVLAQAAEVWLMYHKLSIYNPIPNCGSLLRDDYVPPPNGSGGEG